MQIIIEMPEGTFESVKRYYEQNQECYALCAYVASGKPLPQGHGRLIDADGLNEQEIPAIKKDGVVYVKLSTLQDLIDNAPTIIEADKESEG